ncbi:MAG: hypothetical protein M1548_09610 [Actinobacteria bacterium]|nr:hypothetical protein [Actinomycetota bacterium]
MGKQMFMLGDDEYSIEEVDRSPHFMAFSVSKNSKLWTYVNIGVFDSVLAFWRHGGSHIQPGDFLRKVARYVIQLGAQKGEIEYDIKLLREGSPALRYIFVPADGPAVATRKRTGYHEVSSGPEITIRGIKWLVEVNTYRLEHTKN